MEDSQNQNSQSQNSIHYDEDQQSQNNNQQQQQNSLNQSNQSQIKKVPRKKLQGEKELEKNKKLGVEVDLALQNKLITLQYKIKQIQNELPGLIQETQDASKHAKELEDKIYKENRDDFDGINKRIQDITVNIFDESMKNQKEAEEDLQKQLDELSLSDFQQIKEDVKSVINRAIVREQESGIEDIYGDLVNAVVNF